MVQIFDLSPTESSASMIGKALGEGLGKRLGLAQAEKSFEEAQGNPLKLATAMGRLLSISPEMARAAGPMYQAMLQMNQANAASQQYAPGTKQVLDQYQNQKIEDTPKEVPDLTTRASAKETIRPTLPMTRDEEMQRAVQLFQANPLLYKNDINNAIGAAKEENAKLIERSQAIQAAGAAQQAAQKGLTNELRDLNNKWGGGNLVPENVYNEVQNKAIQSMLPKEEGGEGLTQQEASQKYIPILDDIARDYKAVDDIGAWTGVWESPGNVLSTINNLRKKFEKRGDLENFADFMVARNDFSPRMAYSLAYKIEDDPKVFSELKKLKRLDPVTSFENPKVATQKISKNLAEKMDKNSSPLSIAQYLERKGYDPQPFMDYLIENQDKLDLTLKQSRQLNKGKQIFPKINDVFLMSQIGVE